MSAARRIARGTPRRSGWCAVKEFSWTFEATDLPGVEAMRVAQAAELNGPVRDSTEEGIVAYEADVVKIWGAGEVIGYACLGRRRRYEGTLLEYWLARDRRAAAAEILRQLSEQCREWLVDTHDFFALSLLMDTRLRYEVDAYTFAFAGLPQSVVGPSGSAALEATDPEDADALYRLLLQDGFYTGGGVETLLPQIRARHLYALRAGEKLFGAGFVGVIDRTPDYADIDRDERRRGWGAILVRELARKCLERGCTPIAICAADNSASRKTLGKSGFFLDGCLLSATLDFPPAETLHSAEADYNAFRGQTRQRLNDLGCPDGRKN